MQVVSTYIWCTFPGVIKPHDREKPLDDFATGICMANKHQIGFSLLWTVAMATINVGLEDREVNIQGRFTLN